MVGLTIFYGELIDGVSRFTNTLTWKWYHGRLPGRVGADATSRGLNPSNLNRNGSGITVDYRDEWEWTPLHVAAASRAHRCAAALLRIATVPIPDTQQPSYP